MDWLPALFLLLHVGGAIFAFGPTLTLPVIGAMGGREPMHGNFALRVSERIERGIILPLALLQAVTGIGLIWTLSIDLTKALWLDVAIVAYVIALLIVFTNQIPVTARLVEATKNPPPAPVAGAPAPSGPPPHIAAMISRVQMGGMATLGLLVLVIILMVLGANGFLGANA